MLLIGSHAARLRGLDLNRPLVDIDLIAEEGEVWSLIQSLRPEVVYTKGGGSKAILKGRDNNYIIEAEFAWEGSTGRELLEMQEDRSGNPAEWFEMGGQQIPVFVATPSALLALKLSHRYLKNSPHFEKTRYDILKMRGAGWTLEGELPLQAWLKRRQKETLSYGHPKLDVGSGEFFNPQQVPYVYIHDTIHLAMAREGMPPAYKEFQMDGAEVKVDRAKWERLPEERKLDSVLEESYVLALERHQIPNGFRPDPRKSFIIALQKVCTSISSGWWREWAWEHYDEARKAMDPGYVERFHRGVRNGVVREVVGDGPIGKVL